jgi:hypothetical protein
MRPAPAGQIEVPDMTASSALRRVSVLVLLLALPAALRAQQASMPIGGPFTGPILSGVPFTAAASAVLTTSAAGGTTRDVRVESRYFRDSSGRVRLERTIPEVGTATSPAVYAVVHTVATEALVHVLDPATKTYRYNGRSMYSTGFGGFGLIVAVTPVRYRTYQFHEWRHGELRRPGYERASGIVETPLGTKQMEGLTVVGRRFTATVLSATKENGGTVEIVDEVWESPELRLVIASRTSDPRSGMRDDRVTKIRRTEPPAHLFEVPADYLERPKASDENYQFLYEPPSATRQDRRPGGR